MNELRLTRLPSGTVTLLFTDIEGSTKLWEEHPEQMRKALAQHDAIIRLAVERNGGHVFKTIGDAFCVAFFRADDALRAALAAQLELQSEPWDPSTAIRVRMALHTGAVESRDGDYFGQPLNRVARLLGIAHGGQVLVPKATYELGGDGLDVPCGFRSLGEHQLKDLARPESVFQLTHPSLSDDFPSLRSLRNLPNNLPEQVTSFIGREREISDVKALLGKTRLLTVTGSGGCGKTRLALQVAADMLDVAVDGVWLAELASLSDPDLLPQTVASIFELKEEPGKPILQALLDHLRSRRVLLLLDNCEHLLEASARLVDAIIRHCPLVTILASSREGLGITGETTYRVPSLGLPEGAESVRWESLSQYEAIRLFVDRAAQVQTGFRATEENAFILAAICKRLDGIPLAIELAAARIRSLSVDEVNRRLDQRFRLLTGGSRTALPRQQTLRSLIDWSYDLLSAQEKLLLCRLSVFSGGWTVESAEHVCQGEGVDESEVLDLLTHLVDKSLVFGDERGGATRYRLLETVRQYARDRLMESTFGETWRDRHLAYFVDLADRAKPHLTGTDQQIWFDRLEVEHDNIRSALAWSSEDGGDSESGAKLAHAVTRFWLLRGYLSEGRGWCLGLLERTPEGYSRWNRANLMNGAGNLCWNLADYPKAKEMFAGAIELAREVGHTMCVSAALSNLATIIKEQGDYVTCTPLFEESVLISREIGDRYGLAMTLGNIAVIWLDQGELAKARATLEESRDILSDLGDPVGYARSLTGLGNLDCLEGHFESARSLFEEALAIQTRLGDPRGVAVTKLLLGILTLRMGDASSACAQLQEGLIGLRALGHLRHIAGSLEELAQASTCLANLPRAARTWGAAERLREVIGTPLPPFQSIQYRENVAMGRLAFGDDEGFQSAWQSGRAMTTEQAVEYALEPFYGTIDAQ